MLVYSKDNYFRKSVLELISDLDDDIDHSTVIFDNGFRIFYYSRKNTVRSVKPLSYLKSDVYSTTKSLSLTDFRCVLKSRPWEERTGRRRKLSLREITVIEMLLKGYSYQLISNILGINRKSVSFYKLNALKKKNEENIYTLSCTIALWNKLNNKMDDPVLRAREKPKSFSPKGRTVSKPQLVT